MFVVEKKVSRKLIVWTIVIIIILLLLLLLFLHFRKVYIERISDYNDSLYDYNYTDDDFVIPDAEPEAQREYKTSDKLSEISFVRVVNMNEDDITWTTDINIKVTGYLQEIDPTTSNINNLFDRVYIFKDSNVDWSISGSEKKEGSENCIFEYIVEGAGSNSIGELNVDTGDVKRTLVPVEGWGSWALTYTEIGFSSDTPEIALEGHVLFPVVETILTTKLKENSICGDYYNYEPVQTINLALSPQFPLKIINVDINEKNFAGSIEVEDDAFDTPAGAPAMFEQAQLELPIDLPYDAPGNWEVSWDINLP